MYKGMYMMYDQVLKFVWEGRWMTIYFSNNCLRQLLKVNEKYVQGF